MHFVVWKTLMSRSAVDPGPEISVVGSLLVGERVLQFESHQGSFGHDYTEIFPAFHRGKRCWVRRDTWVAETGYSASGSQEFVLPFQEGVKLLVEHDVYLFMPNKDYIKLLDDICKALLDESYSETGCTTDVIMNMIQEFLGEENV